MQLVVIYGHMSPSMVLTAILVMMVSTVAVVCMVGVAVVSNKPWGWQEYLDALQC